MKISKLKTNNRNPRTITKEAFEKLKKSIERDPEFMRLRPIVHDVDGTVLGGNMRLKAIQALGMKDIPDKWAVLASDLTDEQKRRFILVDNAPPGMAGDWDIDVLANDWEVPELEELGFDLDAFMPNDIPDDNKDIDEDAMADTQHECPKCGFKW